MVGINVSADVKKAKKQLSRIQKKQIPFALSRAINDSLEDAERAEKGAIRNYIDRPTPWAMRGFKVNRSHKTRLRGSLEIQPSQWSYLKYQIEGGTSRRAGKPHAIPSGVATNKYGGMTRNKVRTLLRQKGTFIATDRRRQGSIQADQGRAQTPGCIQGNDTTSKAISVR